MAGASSGVFTVAGASSGGSAAVRLTNDPFGIALASRFAGLTASYASSASGLYSYPSGSTLLAVAPDQGLVTVVGASASSALVVADGDRLAYAGRGDATVVSGDGNDTVTAGAGTADTIAAGSGFNVIDVSGAASAYVDSFGNDAVRAGSGRDTVAVDGVNTATTIDGGSGSLLVENQGSTGTAVNLSTGDVRLLGQGGTATVTGGTDTLYGAANAVLTLSNGSHDNVFVANDPSVLASGGSVAFDGSAASGGNEFWAGSGNASLIGGLGADTLVAGMGNATLTGGSGSANTFAFFTVQGSAEVDATITDFAAASGNKVALFGYGQAGVTQALSSAVQVGTGVQMTLDDGTRITLANFSKAELKASDFIWTNAPTS